MIEHTLAQMNRPQVLAQVYRRRRDGHTRAVRIVGGLVNRRITAVPLKIYPMAVN